MGIVHQEAQPVWEATTNPALPWRVETSQYVAEMADYLDAGATLGGVLWRFTHRAAGSVTTYSPEAIAYIDHLQQFDPMQALAHVQATAAGDLITFDHPAYRVTYQALHDRLKLTILLKAVFPLRAPNPALVTVETAFLSLTGGIQLPADLEVWDRTGLRVGDLTTHGEVYLKDASGSVVQFLDRVTARDSDGHPGAGQIRLATDTNGTRRLYQGMSWGWLQVASFAPTEAYPDGGVEIDPTVVSPSSSSVGFRRITPLSTGRLVAFENVAGGTACSVSDDAGQSWQLCTSPASGIITTYTGAVAVVPDADDHLHVLIASGTYAAPNPLVLLRVVISGLTAMVVSNQVEAAPATNFAWDKGDLLVDGAAGATKTVTLAYARSASGLSGTHTMRARISNVTMAGAYASTWTSDLDTTTDRNDGYNLALAKRGDGTIKLLFSESNVTAGTSSTKIISGLGGTVTTVKVSDDNPPSKLVGIDGFGQCLWLTQKGGTTVSIWNEAGVYATFTNAATGIDSAYPIAAIGDAARDRIIIAGRETAATHYLRKADIGFSGKTISNALTVESSVALSTGGACCAKAWDGTSLPVLFSDGTQLYTHTVVFNVAPAMPTITLSSSAFAAATGTNVTIGHNDSDQMSAWALKRVYGNETFWWNNASKAFDQTSEYWNTGASGFSVIIPAADNAGDWTTGRVYQLYAATRDSQGLTGLYNATGVVANVGAKPLPAITSASTSMTAEYTLRFSVDVAISKYQVRVLDGATQVSTTGQVLVPAAREQTVILATTGKTYTLELIAWDQTGIASDPVTLGVTTSFITPARPTITATPQPTAYPPSIRLDVGNPDNLLTKNQSDVETDLTGLTGFLQAADGTALTSNFVRDTAAAVWQGAATARVVSTSATPGTLFIQSSPILTPVQAGETYSFGVYSFASWNLFYQAAILWFNASGAQISEIHSALVPTNGDVAQRLAVSGTAPAGAVSAHCRIFMKDAQNGAAMSWDGAQFQAGPLTTWGVGGGPKVTGNTILRRIKDSTSPWATLPGTVAPNGTYNDTSAASGVTYEYGVSTLGDNGTTITGYTDGVTFRTAVMTFAGKVAGSMVENPHTFISRWGALTDLPTQTGYPELDQPNYDRLAAADLQVVAGAGVPSGQTLQQVMTFDSATDLKRKGVIPLGWTGADVRAYIKTLAATWVGYGVGANAAVSTNGARVKVWGGSWFDWSGNTASAPATVSFTVDLASFYTDTNGFMHLLAHTTYPADGTRKSIINTDYIQLSVEVYVQTTAMITRDCWWFAPVDNPSLAIPFAFNREASWQHDRAFQEIETRGSDTRHVFGGKKRDTVNITATFVDPEWATPHESVNLPVEQWRQRFIDLVGVKGYLLSPQGFAKRGILEPPSGQFVRDMIINPVTISCRFVEKKGGS